jgi:formylglycine-generating enzyme required for sulfatase activity
MAHDVFLSYSSKDKAPAGAICRALESAGLNVWIASRDVLPGADWMESIINAIDSAQVMVLVFPGNANDSEQIKREVHHAADAGVAIVPVRIEDVKPSKRLEYLIGARHWFDAFPPPHEPHFARLAQDVKRLLESPFVRKGSEAPSPEEARRAKGEAAEAARRMEEERRSREQAEAAERKLAEAAASRRAVEEQLRKVEAATAAGIAEVPQEPPPPKKLGWMAMVAALGLVLLIGSAFLYFHGWTLFERREPQLVDASRPAPAPALVQNAFAVAKHKRTVAAWDEFLGQYGSEPLAELAREERDALRDKERAAAAAPCGGVTLASFSTRGAAPLSANEECALQAKAEFKECDSCPTMVVVPEGSFTMGSPKDEPGHYDDEGPQRDMRIGKALAVGKFQVTIAEFSVFVAETSYDVGSSCYRWSGGGWKEIKGASFRSPGFAQNGSHPATCLSWNDAKAHTDWLWKKKTKKPYRLLTEAEWEYAARGRTAPGAYPRYFFGEAEGDFCRFGNGADQTAKQEVPGASGWTVLPCSDGWAYTSPVGSFEANAFGLYDMHGNVWQWVEDCWNENYKGTPPSDGSAWTSGDCSRRVLRGGSWQNIARSVRAAHRRALVPANRYVVLGLRVARTLTH